MSVEVLSTWNSSSIPCLPNKFPANIQRLSVHSVFTTTWEISALWLAENSDM